MADPVVLVVDDDTSVLQRCQRVLDEAHIRVIPELNSAQALQTLGSVALDAVLVDICMLHFGETELLTSARKSQPEIAIVLMTGFDTIETAIKSLRHGVDGLLLKPFNNTDLLETVQAALENVKARREATRLRALRPLFLVNESLFSETNLNNLADLIVHSVSSQLRCSFVGLYRRMPDVDAFEAIAFEGDPRPVNACMAQHHGLFEDFISKRSLWVNKVGPGDRRLQDLLDDLHLSAVMCVPMVILDDSGFLVVTRRMGDPGFQQADFEMLVILARQASLALENAHLHDQLMATIQRLERTRSAMTRAEKMASLGRMTASIAHEINNPLQTLSNCLYLANRKDLSWQEREIYIEKAQGELDLLVQTFHTMLDLFRPEARDRRLVNVNDLIPQVLNLLRTRLEMADVQVHTHLEENLPPILAVDSQIQQALINLIINAVEAMPQGGEIWIITRRRVQKDRDRETDDGIEILIEDTGLGLPAGSKEITYEPFASLFEDGSRFGLAVSYGIVTAHQGTLNLIEGNGLGACFQIILPEGKPL